MLGTGRSRSHCPRTLAWLQRRGVRATAPRGAATGTNAALPEHAASRCTRRICLPRLTLARPCGLRASRSCALAWCTARCILAPRCCRAHPHYARPRRPRAGGLSSPRPRPHAVSTGAARSGRFATAARPASARCVPLVRLSAVAASADRQMRALAARPHRTCLACRLQPLRPAPLLPPPTRPGRRGRCCSPPRPRG